MSLRREALTSYSAFGRACRQLVAEPEREDRGMRYFQVLTGFCLGGGRDVEPGPPEKPTIVTAPGDMTQQQGDERVASGLLREVPAPAVQTQDPPAVKTTDATGVQTRTGAASKPTRKRKGRKGATATTEH